MSYNNLTRKLAEYFLCEALGPSASCSREDFEKYSYPFLEGFAALCRVLVQLGILIFAVNSKGLDGNACCEPKVVEKTRNLSVVNPVYF